MRVLVFSLLLFAASVQAQFAQQGAKLRAADGMNGPALGTSVAISFDGNTAVAGGPTNLVDQGAVWIFTRNGKVWSQQGPRLIATGATSNARQGTSVAISADGNTVLAGAPRDVTGDDAVGAAFVFTRTAGVWTQQGTKLVGSGAAGASEQGTAVALSADGNTAMVGGPADNGSHGAAWIFTRSNGTWSQQGAKLTGFLPSGPSNQGFAVALSGDGDTAILGGPSGTDGGAAWIFRRSNGAWAQESLKLIGFGSVGAFPRYGSAVGLSHDGSTAIVGAPVDNSDRGAAWIYVRSGEEWEQQDSKLVGTTEHPGGNQGVAVSLSADGNTAVIGGHQDHPGGAFWVFTRDELGEWTQQGSKLAGSGAATQFGSAFQGRAVAISGNATTIVESGFAEAATGAVWPFAKAVPTIATLSGNLQSAKVNTAFAPLTVVVRDAADQPSSNASVTFTITAGPSGASGTFGSSATVLTNANGIATAPTLTANGTIGGFIVTATTAAAPAAATFNLGIAALATPANVTATATATPTINVSWTATPGATQYEVARSNDGITYTLRATTSDTSFIDSSQIFSGTIYFYRVRATLPDSSAWSAPDYAYAVVFTDSVLAGMPVKGTHFMELRQAIHAVRAAATLDVFPWTDSHLPGEPVKALHLNELRAALEEARARLLLPSVLYARPSIGPGTTPIAAADVLELRAAVQ